MCFFKGIQPHDAYTVCHSAYFHTQSFVKENKAESRAQAAIILLTTLNFN